MNDCRHAAFRRTAQALACAGLLALSAAAGATGNWAPAAAQVSSAIVNYHRADEHVGSAGLLGDAGLAEARALGFALVVDLRTPAEGTEAEREMAAFEGIDYVNIPVGRGAPDERQVEAFARLVEDTANHPVLVHCRSANRVGAMWALYRVSRGVPAETAIAEGRRLGMSGSREEAVRERLAARVALR